MGHRSVARRISEICPIVLIAVRSISADELTFVEGQGIPAQFWDATSPGNVSRSVEIAERHLTSNVYISIDLDALDPSIMGAVGTPEPGGLLWHELLNFLSSVSRRANIVGFDIVELSPSQGAPSCAFTAAKLAYKLIGYATQVC